MNSFNELKIIGNLAVDPELTYTQGGTALCKFNVAVNKKVKEEEKVFFLSCEVWKESAEIFDKYVKKGHRIFLNGELAIDNWNDAEGNKKTKTKMVVREFYFLEKAEKNN